MPRKYGVAAVKISSKFPPVTNETVETTCRRDATAKVLKWTWTAIKLLSEAVLVKFFNKVLYKRSLRNCGCRPLPPEFFHINYMQCQAQYIVSHVKIRLVLHRTAARITSGVSVYAIERIVVLRHSKLPPLEAGYAATDHFTLLSSV